ncbi:MAG: glycosyltransferase family 9 protein [Candidatus Omnitrophota bacterium]
MSRRYVYTKKRYVLLFFIVDFFGFLFYRIFSFFKKLAIEAAVKRIVVVELAHLGDVLAITPALHLLRKKFPQSAITVIVSPWTKEAIAGNPDVDEVLVYRASWFDRETKRPFSFRETKAFIKIIRAKAFDLGIDLRGDARTILLMWFGGIKKRIGYVYAGAGFLLTDIIPFDVNLRQEKHQIAHNMAFIEAIGPRESINSDLRMRIFFSEEDRQYINTFLRSNGITESDFLLVVHPGSGLASKCWPIERFAELLGRITCAYPVKIVVVGGAQEKELSLKLRVLTKAVFVDATGKTTVKQLAALMSSCRLFIGSDSGVMHIACASGVPVVAIWGGHNKPAHWGPLVEQATVIHKEIECSPCGLATCGHLSCLKNITVDEVAQEAFKHIARDKQMRP